jgi:outer membrane protein OmpA-like peptidoglycan-associated protein
MRPEMSMPLLSLYRASPLILLAIALIQSASLYGQTYSASFNDAEWTAQSGPFACSLSHKIPGFGAARFVRNAGAAEFLELKHSRQAFPLGVVKVESIPPVWRTDASPAFLGQVQAGAQQPLQVAAGAQIEMISKSLGQGTNVMFSGVQVNASGSSLRVALTANNFPAAYGKYERCIAQLIPYTFNQLARTQFIYSLNADELETALKSQLDKIVRYTKADPRVLGIIVDAHSEKLSTSEEGDAASRKQAELVAAYLINKGLAADTITVRWHGDKFPVANNGSAAGQAKNRRVTIRLENETTRKEMEKKIGAIKEAELNAAEQKAAAEQSARSQPSSASATLPLNLQQLEQMVEKQNLTSGKQPTLKSVQ